MNPIDPTTLRHPTIVSGLVPRKLHTKSFSKIDWLCNIADVMEVGDAVALTFSEAGTMRIILKAKGFDCISDGFNKLAPKGYQYVFKLNYDKTTKIAAADGHQSSA